MKLRYNDKAHGYWIDGKRCMSVTAIAKAPDSTYGLDQWRKRQIAIGLARDYAENGGVLIESVAQHHTDKTKLDELCEQAMSTAGAWQAAERGTSAHRTTERVDAGEDMIETETSRRVAKVWRQLLDEAGLEVIPDMIERVVVYPDQLVAGKFDRFLRRKSDGRTVVADLKTGDGAIRYPHSVAVQLAAYANAPLLAGRWEGLDGETEDFDELPADLDRERGYVIYLPAEGTAEVFTVDIAAGRECLQHIVFPILAWRKRKDLLHPLSVKIDMDSVRVDLLEERRTALLFAVNGLPAAVQATMRADWPYPGLSLKRRDGWDADKLEHVELMVKVLRGFPKATIES